MNKNIPNYTTHLLYVKPAAQFLGVKAGNIRRGNPSKLLSGLKVVIRGD